MSIESLLEQASEAARKGLWAEAKKFYEVILLKNDSQVEALANLASIYARTGELSEALALFQKATGLDPSVPEIWFNFANLLAKTGQRKKAENAYRNALKRNAQLVPAWFSLAVLLSDEGRVEEARDCFMKTTELAPDFAQGHRKFGNFLLDQHRPEEALKYFRQYRMLNPGDLHICLNMVDALVEMEAFGEAVVLLQSALETEPQNEMFLLPLAHLLPLTGRHLEAVQCWLNLLDKDPQNHEAHLQLGTLLFQQKEYTQAVLHLRTAVTLEPGDLNARVQLGFSLAELGCVSEARTIALNLVADHPHEEMVHMLDGFVAIQQARIQDGLDAYRRAQQARPDSKVCISNMCQGSMYADFFDAGQVTALHVEMSRKISDSLAIHTIHSRSIGADDRIRVGYISPDFRSHPVGFFLQPILENHDHEVFEIFGYGIGSEPDKTGRELISQLDHWRFCTSMNDKDLVRKIREDQLDILVDLGGYTANSRMSILASRVAPAQASYLGYPCTTGMQQMDFIIGDQNLMPAGSESLYSEQQAKLNAGFLCFIPRPGTPEVASLPQSINGYITFGSFNNLSKVSDRCVRIWANVLKAVTDSRLLLKAQVLMDAGTCELTWKRFEAYGIGRERVILQGPTVPVQVFLGEYAKLDIALDSMPYNGGTTSCDALWMGVPVVSLAGRHFHERMGSSILKSLGRPEWIAQDEETYIETAAALASDAVTLGIIRQELREQMRVSPLCDAIAMTRDLEGLFRKMLG